MLYWISRFLVKIHVSQDHVQSFEPSAFSIEVPGFLLKLMLANIMSKLLSQVHFVLKFKVSC